MPSWKLTSVALCAATALAVASEGCERDCREVNDGCGFPTGPGSGSSNPTTSASTVGSGTPDGGARDMFITQVYPSLMNEPAGQTCGSCHNGTLGPQFLVDSAEGTYTFLQLQTNYIALPDNSILYLQGLIVHTGPALTTNQAELVEAWLLEEAGERGLTGGGGAGGGTTQETLAQAVEQFGGCMSLTDWTDNGLQELFDAQVKGGQTCKDCHSEGQNSTWLGPDVDVTFEKNTQFPYIMRLVHGTQDDSGNFADLIESKRFQQKGQEACLNPPCHPEFELSDELKAGLHQFFELTKLKYDSGPCMGDGTGGGGGAGGAGGAGGGMGGEGGAGGAP